MALQFPVELIDKFVNRAMSVVSYPLVHPLQGGLQLFPAGFALENPFALAAFAQIVGEAQKVKRMWRALVPAVHLNEFGFLRV